MQPNHELNNLSERLKFALKILGVSQTELAKKIDVKPQVIQYLCAASSQKSKFIFDIAKALNIDALWLATGRGIAPSGHSSQQNEKKIPILTFNQIIDWKIRQKNISTLTIDNWLSIGNGFSNDCFAVALSDNSMAPRFSSETIIILDPTAESSENNQPNKFVLAFLEDENFLVFRQLELSDNARLLIPLNQSLHKKTALKQKDIILGFCIEARWLL